MWSVLQELLRLPRETEWLEFKRSRSVPDEIGQYISALSNSACLHQRDVAYIVWGVDDNRHVVVGTNFLPRDQKIGNEELENWLAVHLDPRIHFKIHEWERDGARVVMFEIPPALHTPVRFKGTAFIRVGTYKKKLGDFPEKERALWLHLSRLPFEKGVAVRGASADEVISLIDYPSYFQMAQQSLPSDKAGILNRLEGERFIASKGQGRYDITNLGALLFARDLSEIESLARKRVRVIRYRGRNRIDTVREQVGLKGYAIAYEGLVRYINDQLPQHEEVGPALRREVSMFPEVAIRELVANALIHQDLNAVGESPMVEIFEDRVEITNPGKPLIEPLRFVGSPPVSRNERLAGVMRRMGICEERGSGIEKVLSAIEFHQLPAPEFIAMEKNTKVILHAQRRLSEMDPKGKVRACYLHACLRKVSNQEMTNASLRKRFSISDTNYATASRIIRDTLDEKLIKPYDPGSKSRRHAKYVPFWA